MEVKCIHLTSNCFKSVHFLKHRNLAISPDHLHTGYLFDQIMRDHIVTFQKFKVMEYLGYNLHSFSKK